MTRKIVSCAAAIMLCGGALTGTAKAETTLKVNIWPHIKHNLVALVNLPWVKMIEKATGGEVKGEIPAAPLAAGADIYDAIAGGVVDITFFVPGYTPARFPTSRAVELPLMGTSATALSLAYWHAQQKYFSKTKEYDDIKLLGTFTHGPGQIIAKKKITGWDDLKGMKMRVGGGVVREAAVKLGAVIIAVPVTKAYEVLSKGVADGIFFPPEGTMSFNLVPVLKHYYEVPGGIYNSAFGLGINKRKWLSLSRETRAKIESVSGDVISRIAGKQWDDRDKQALKLMAEGGIDTTVADAKAVARLRQIGTELEKQWISDVAKLGVDGAAALKAIRSESSKPM